MYNVDLAPSLNANTQEETFDYCHSFTLCWSPSSSSPYPHTHSPRSKPSLSLSSLGHSNGQQQHSFAQIISHNKNNNKSINSLPTRAPPPTSATTICHIQHQIVPNPNSSLMNLINNRGNNNNNNNNPLPLTIQSIQHQQHHYRTDPPPQQQHQPAQPTW